MKKIPYIDLTTGAIFYKKKPTLWEKIIELIRRLNNAQRRS